MKYRRRDWVFELMLGLLWLLVLSIFFGACWCWWRASCS